MISNSWKWNFARLTAEIAGLSRAHIGSMAATAVGHGGRLVAASDARQARLMRLQSYRVELLGTANTVVHAYNVMAQDAREALVMARLDFPRLRETHDAATYRVFDPRALMYRDESGAYRA